MKKKAAPSAASATAVLRVCSKTGDWVTARQVLRSARENEVTLDTAALNDFLCALQRSGHYEATASIFLLLFATSSDKLSEEALKRALPWMPDFGESGFHADLVTFQVAMKACLKGGLTDMAVAVWRCLQLELRKTSGGQWRRPTARGSARVLRPPVPVRPDLSLWSMYVSVLLADGREPEALAVLSEMHAARIPPTQRTLDVWDRAVLR